MRDGYFLCWQKGESKLKGGDASMGESKLNIPGTESEDALAVPM